MKKIIKTILIFFPLVILLVLTNIIVDPANLFNKNFEQQVALELIAGNNVSGVLNMDDREMISNYIDNLDKDLDCLVLGASRGLQISSETIGVENTFNFGVTGAELRDIISIYYKYENNFSPPETVIITLEPWTLSDSQVNPRALTKEYEEFCIANNLNYVESSTFETELNKVLELFNLAYFQQSVQSIFSEDFNFERIASVTADTVGDSDIRLSDGRYSYSLDFVNRSEAEIAEDLKNMQLIIPLIIRQYNINENLLSQFETFIADLKTKDVDIIFFIPPIHPEYYDFIMDTPHSVAFTETLEIYNEIATENNIEVIGSYSMENITEDDFYDVLHPRYQTVYNMFNSDI